MQRSLFDDSSDFRLPYLLQDEVESRIATAYPLLWQAIQAPWQDFQVDRSRDMRFRDLDEGQAAWWLHTQIRRTAGILIDDCPEYGLSCSPESSQQFYVSLNDEIVFVFKKLVRRFLRRRGEEVLMRSNYPTQGNCDFWEQRRQSGALDAHRLIVGYEPVKEMTDVRIFVGYPRSKGRRFTWIYEMPNQAEAAKALSRSAPAEVQVSESRKGFVVESLHRESGERGA